MIICSNSQQSTPTMGCRSKLVKFVSLVQSGTLRSSLELMISGCVRLKCKRFWHNKSVRGSING